MKYVLIVCIALYIILNIVDMLLDKHNKKQKAQFKKEINERCDEIMASAERTEATIAEERKKYGDLPEEYREEFLAKYDDIEKQINNIKADVTRIQHNL